MGRYEKQLKQAVGDILATATDADDAIQKLQEKTTADVFDIADREGNTEKRREALMEYVGDFAAVMYGSKK